MSTRSTKSDRRKHAVESFKTAAECIGNIESGIALFAVTRGQWSMIDAILHCLEQCGPSAVSLWTWTVAEYEIECLERLRRDNRITNGTLVIDHGARHKNAGLIRQWKASFGASSVRYVVNHAKIATIHGGGHRLLLRGSMNLNHNPRFEQFDITEGGADYELVKRIEEEIPVLTDDSEGNEVYSASRVGEAFDAEQLSIFQGIKPWAK